MKKVRLFFAAAALVLATSAVFATKDKFFAAPPNLYYENGNVYTAITTSALSSSAVLGTGTGLEQAFLNGATGKSYPLYAYNSGWEIVYNEAF